MQYLLSFFVHIILLVVVLLILVLIVGLSLLVLAMVLVLPTGTVALLYCIASYYALRGGISGSSAFCGAFYVSVNAGDGSANWLHGAALYCKVCNNFVTFCNLF